MRSLTRHFDPGYCRAAFTLVELMMAMAITSILLVAAITAAVALERNYAATEQYATGTADQMRLLDYLAMDLRRALPLPPSTPPWTMDPDGQGITINVADYYSFAANDPQHLFPIPNNPAYDSVNGAPLYSTRAGASSNPPPYRVISYRFLNGSITRSDPWQPLSSDGQGGYVSAGPMIIASNMSAIPTVTPDPADISGGTVHYNITFHSIFQPLSVPNSSNASTLYNVTFVRSKYLAH